RNFDVRPAPAYQEGEVPLQIAEAVHPRAEVEGAAQEIIRLVREENYRFQDIAVFIRQTDVYHDLIRSEEHTSELQSRFDLVCRLLLEKKNKYIQKSKI